MLVFRMDATGFITDLQTGVIRIESQDWSTGVSFCGAEHRCSFGVPGRQFDHCPYSWARSGHAVFCAAKAIQPNLAWNRHSIGSTLAGIWGSYSARRRPLGEANAGLVFDGCRLLGIADGS